MFWVCAKFCFCVSPGSSIASYDFSFGKRKNFCFELIEKILWSVGRVSNVDCLLFDGSRLPFPFRFPVDACRYLIKMVAVCSFKWLCICTIFADSAICSGLIRARMSTLILNYWGGSVLGGFGCSVCLACTFIGGLVLAGLILALDEPLILSADLTSWGLPIIGFEAFDV